MNKKKEDNKTITMTEAQLKEIIRSSIKTALRELKEEEKLPGNEVDELKTAPATYSMIILISEFFLGFIVTMGVFVPIACGKLIYQNGFNFNILLFGICFIFIGIFAFMSIREINKTKKIEVLNTVFSALMALSSLIVAIVGAVFAYKSLN